MILEEAVIFVFICCYSLNDWFIVE
jgi:hypothetical protein